MHPSQRCAWIPPSCKHAARFCRGSCWLDGGLVSGDVSRTAQDALHVQLVGVIVRHSSSYGRYLRQPLDPAKKPLITTLRDEIRQPDQQVLRLTIPREERLARVTDALLDDVADDRTLDAWADVAGMARRTFVRAFSAQARHVIWSLATASALICCP